MSGPYEFFKQLKKTFESYRRTLLWLIWYSDKKIPRQNRWSYHFLPMEIWRKIWVDHVEGRELNVLLWKVKEALLGHFPKELRVKFEAWCWGYLEATLGTEKGNAGNSNISANVIKRCILEKALTLNVTTEMNKIVQCILNQLMHDQLKVMQRYCGIVLRPLPRDGLVFGKTQMIKMNSKTKELFLLLREDSEHFAVIQSVTTKRCIFMDQYGYDIKTGDRFLIFKGFVVANKGTEAEAQSKKRKLC